MIKRAKVQRATMMGVCNYRPGFYPGRLVMFLPSPRARRRTEGLLRWHGLANQVEEYCGPEGCEGDTMLTEPYVPAIAEFDSMRRNRTAGSSENVTNYTESHARGRVSGGHQQRVPV